MENTQGGLSGKTCRARCPLTMGRISGKSSKALSASKTPGQMFLCLRQGAGCPPARSWATVILSPGASLDAAQGWGVAQRRKRVFAVLDLDGGRAGQVLFESEGVSGYTPPGCEARQGAAGGTESRIGAAGFRDENSASSRGIGFQEERAPTLRNGKPPASLCRGRP